MKKTHSINIIGTPNNHFVTMTKGDTIAYEAQFETESEAIDYALLLRESFKGSSVDKY